MFKEKIHKCLWTGPVFGSDYLQTSYNYQSTQTWTTKSKGYTIRHNI